MKQTTIRQTTGARYLLRDLAEPGNVVFGMFAGPHVTVRHWPVYYRVYVEVDGLCREVNRLGEHLARGFIDADGTVAADRIADANACFTSVDGHVRAMATLLAGTILPIDPHPTQWREDEIPVERQQFGLAPEYARALNGRTIREVQAALNQVYAALGGCFAQQCPSVGALLHPRSPPGPASMGFFYSARTLHEVHEPVRDLPGGLAVYVSRDHTFATIGTRGIRPADGTPGLIIHVSVDITDDDRAKRSSWVIPAQSRHNGECTTASADELNALLFSALIAAGLVPSGARFDDERWRYF